MVESISALGIELLEPRERPSDAVLFIVNALARLDCSPPILKINFRLVLTNLRLSVNPPIRSVEHFESNVLPLAHRRSRIRRYENVRKDTVGNSRTLTNKLSMSSAMSDVVTIIMNGESVTLPWDEY